VEPGLDAYLIVSSEKLKPDAVKILYGLRKANIVSDMNYMNKSFIVLDIYPVVILIRYC